MKQCKQPVWKRLVSLLLICVMIGAVPLQPMVAIAATPTKEEYNAAVLAKTQELEEKYGIVISYPMRNGTAGIGTATLSNLDRCLSTLTAGVVKKLSAWYKTNKGVPITFDYTHTPFASQRDDMIALASFTPALALMQIYTPPSSAAGAVLTGNGPIAIIHEMGHAFHEYAKSVYGASSLSRDWQALNGKQSYGSGADYSASTFVTAYASTAYSEDFADTFSHGFICTNAGFSIAGNLTKNGAATALGKKVSFMEQLLVKCFGANATVVSNFQKCRSTPTTLTYEGLKLSGNSLEYIGYNAPFGVLASLLKYLGIKEETSKWERSIGGWTVTATSGQTYLVFPGGEYTKL
ncbi:putative zinc-binding metallopeptidase [Ruminococcaceae bacterium OttesenSCG-928-L11]|nr:putative zinc-binding metallopeptidase [Ruminococcaceae bacterium OttesenSCG-928-L11]